MVMMDVFLAGDGSIDFPDERATFRDEDEKATGKLFRRFYAQAECETPNQLRSLPPSPLRRYPHHAR